MTDDPSVDLGWRGRGRQAVGAAVLIAIAAAPACGGTPDEVRGSVLAVDVATGTTRWAANVDAIALGPPSVSGGVLSVLGVQMPVRCQFDVSAIELDATSGRLASAASLRPVDVPFSSSDPNFRHLAAAGVAYTSEPLPQAEERLVEGERYPVFESRITAVPEGGSTPTWQRVVPAAGPPALAHGDDVLVVASLASTVAASIGEDTMPLHVEALDLATGTTRWTATISADGPFDVHRLGQHDVRFAPVAGSYPWDQDPGGHLILNYPGYGEQSAAILGGRVYVPHSEDALAVLDLGTGAALEPVDGIGGPVTATGEVLVGRRDDDVVGFDDRGRVLWSTPLPDDAELVRAAAHDGTAYIAVSGRYGGGPCSMD